MLASLDRLHNYALSISAPPVFFPSAYSALPSHLPAPHHCAQLPWSSQHPPSHHGSSPLDVPPLVPRDRSPSRAGATKKKPSTPKECQRKAKRIDAKRTPKRFASVPSRPKFPPVLPPKKPRPPIDALNEQMGRLFSPMKSVANKTPSPVHDPTQKIPEKGFKGKRRGRVGPRQGSGWRVGCQIR